MSSLSSSDAKSEGAPVVKSSSRLRTRQARKSYKLDSDDEDFEARLHAFNDENADQGGGSGDENDSREISSEQLKQNREDDGNDSASEASVSSKRSDAKGADQLNFSCDHCGRKFTSVNGLKYHSDKKVCLKPQKRGRPRKEATSLVVAEEPTKKLTHSEDDASHESGSSETQQAKKRKKINAKFNFSCEHCYQTFSSAHGLRYHLDKRVCLDPRKSRARKGHQKRKFEESNNEVSESGVARMAKVSKSDSQMKVEEDDIEYKCQLCDKVFKSRTSLNYHTENNVCQPEKRKPKTPFKRERGPKDQRTCPLCKRVFTSILGYQYHRDKAVCARKSAVIEYPTLHKGDEFMTKLGVLRVIKDDRAIPQPLASPQKISKSRSSSKQARARTKVDNVQLVLLVRNLHRRKLLTSLYEQRKLNAEAIDQVSYGGDPSTIPREEHAEPPHRTVDEATHPPRSFPNRIVECILVNDKRDRVDLDGNVVQRQFDDSCKTGIRMFVPRQILGTPHVEDDICMACEDCGATFSARPSFKYHVQNKVCSNRVLSLQQNRDRLLEMAQKRMNKALQEEARKSKKEVKTKRLEITLKINDPMEALTGKASAAPPLKRKSEAQKPQTAKPKAEYSIYSEHPDDMLRRLERDLLFEQSKLLGPMYTDVFKKLKYKVHVPKKPKKKTRKKPAIAAPKQAPETQNQETSLTNRPDPALVLLSTDNSLPPMIDTVVLAAEVDSGRYPSMSRDPNRTSSKTCNVCKKADGENLFRCGFCCRSVHFACLRTKYLTKFPEPMDDFLCNMCIQYICHRRARAEKRRVSKLGRDLETEQQAAETVAELTESIVPGREYECVAAQGRRMNELKELLHENRLRLMYYTEAAKANRVRHFQIHGTPDPIL